MKTILLFMGCLMMIGCGSDPQSMNELGSIAEPTSGGSGSGGSGVGSGSQCHGITFITVLVDGVPQVEAVPTACNTGPNIDKGDPAPDNQGDPNPWDRKLAPSEKTAPEYRK